MALSWQPRRIADSTTQSYYFDDFIAATSSLTVNYLTSLVGLGSVISTIDSVGGCIQLDTGSLLSTSAQLYLKNSIIRADYETCFKCRFRMLQTTQMVFRVGMESSDGYNSIELYYDVGLSDNE